MDIKIDFKTITEIFRRAHKEERDSLFEYEVYELLSLAGSETPPKVVFFPKGKRLEEDTFRPIPGDQLVIKIVSPYIVHKSDVKGVAVVPKSFIMALSTIRRMLSEVPEQYAAILQRDPAYAPEAYRHLSERELVAAINEDIRGVILCQYMPPDNPELGNELIVSIRRTREFGMVLSAGVGGTDTELYAQRLRKGQAVVAAATEMIDGDTFFRLFQGTLSYTKLAGLTRSHRRIVTDEQLRECFTYFIALANYFSPTNPEAPFVIEELEINPFAFTSFLMVPLDGVCRFSLPQDRPAPRPLAKIDKMLHPQNIGIMGVSATKLNVGRIILDNILASGYDPGRLRVIHPDAPEIAGLPTVPSLEALQEKLDLLVLAVGADQVPELIQLIMERDLCESVLLIPGGIGEKSGSEHIARRIQDDIRRARSGPGGGPVILGGNSIGILSHPGNYDTIFIPENKLPKHRGTRLRRSALISQSGAYMITRMSKLPWLDPAYTFSIGNQIDLTAGDLLRVLSRQEAIRSVACYMEGFNYLDGLEFAQAVREATLRGKYILFYKAGRTPEGKTATSGHTASVAGDYLVCESCIRQAGAIVANTFRTFEGICRLDRTLWNKTIAGRRLAAMSNAGYEAVGMADNIVGEDYHLELTPLTDHTRARLAEILARAGLQNLVNVRNPIDVTPMTREEAYEAVLRTLLEDPTVDAVVAGLIPLAPLMHTVPEGGDADPAAHLTSESSIPNRITRLAAEFDKPLVMVIDGGHLFDPLVEALRRGGVAVFRSADQAVQILGKYIQGRLEARSIAAGRGLLLD